jgi:translation initiation factor IF-3
VPPRHGPDNRPPAGPSTRINEAIRGDTVRLIDADGTNVGIVSVRDAQERASRQDLDLVEIAPEAQPPVCRIMDYGKWRYDQEQKAKQARKHQSTITIKEIKFRPKIDPHDYATKKGHVERFLNQQDKVKVTIMFRGREVMHAERGERILDQLADELKEIALVESKPNLDGRNMVMMLAPIKRTISKGDGAGPRKPTEPGDEPSTEAVAESGPEPVAPTSE